MGIVIPLAAALLATASSAPAPPAWGLSGSRPPLPEQMRGGPSRFDNITVVTVRARIVRDSASIGPGRGPPARGMLPRQASITAADGRVTPALIYDFE